jgi:hypothetical protein
VTPPASVMSLVSRFCFIVSSAAEKRTIGLSSGIWCRTYTRSKNAIASRK